MKLQKTGFKVCEKTYTKAEVNKMRKIIAQIFSENRNMFRTIQRKGYTDYHVSALDIKSIQDGELFKLLMKKTLIDDIKSELKVNKIQFFGDTSIMVGEGERGFHKDNANRMDDSAADWNADYDIVRCGLYLQDTRNFSGGLQLRIGSHHKVSRWRGRIFNFEGKSGDIAYWKLTTTHSGNRRILKFPRSLNLIPRIASALPSWLFRPYEKERYAIFFTFAAENSKYLEDYVKHLNDREDTYGFLDNRYCEDIL